VLLGGLLLALPQLYGVGYPVMNKAVAGQYVLWFLLFLMTGKVVAASLTIGIGGSGGVFAPSLFTGAMAGTAFGVIAVHLFGTAVGSPAIYGVIAMGAVFAAAAQAPLTALASVVEMTGNYTLTLPVMLAVGLAAGISRRLSYGTIYTTKLLRRGTDIDRPKPSSVLQLLTVGDVMQPLDGVDGRGCLSSDGPTDADHDEHAVEWTPPQSQVLGRQRPRALFEDETLEQALRQLVLYGPGGLPVVSADRHSLIGWITNQDVVNAIADRITAARTEVPQATRSAEFAVPHPADRRPALPGPLDGYELVEIRLTGDEATGGRGLHDLHLPTGAIPTAVTTGQTTTAARNDMTLHPGDHLLVLLPAHRKDGADDD
jgi:chloride channel protein, CIC family